MYTLVSMVIFFSSLIPMVLVWFCDVLEILLDGILEKVGHREGSQAYAHILAYSWLPDFQNRE